MLAKQFWKNDRDLSCIEMPKIRFWAQKHEKSLQKKLDCELWIDGFAYNNNYSLFSWWKSTKNSFQQTDYRHNDNESSNETTISHQKTSRGKNANKISSGCMKSNTESPHLHTFQQTIEITKHHFFRLSFIK